MLSSQGAVFYWNVEYTTPPRKPRQKAALFKKVVSNLGGKDYGRKRKKAGIFFRVKGKEKQGTYWRKDKSCYNPVRIVKKLVNASVMRGQGKK